MKGKLVKLILVLPFIILLLVDIQPAKSDLSYTDDQGKGPFHLASGPYISFPDNETYDSGLQTLHIDFYARIGDHLNYSMSYSLDGKENEAVALTEHYFGFWEIHRNYLDGSVALPALSNGSHYITVYIEGLIWNNPISRPSYNYTSFDSQTVYFTVLSPIALLIEKNKTYNTNEIPLDYYVDGAASQVAYSLDFHSNVTVTGNTTLTGLTEGTHIIIIYANNTWGNATSIDINTFTIAKPAPSQSTSPTFQIQNAFLLILILSVAIVAISILIVLRKRKLTHKLTQKTKIPLNT